MNAQEKRWINNWLHKIWVIDSHNDCQADDITDFLWELARRTGYQYFPPINEGNFEEKVDF